MTKLNLKESSKIMGCDIHTMIEFKEEGRDKWRSFGYDSVNLGRDYSMFSAMANVRNYGDEITPIEAKGFPQDASFSTVNANSFFVTENADDDSEYVSRESAERWVTQGISDWVNDRKNRVTDPDAHTHSYLNAEEFALCIERVSKVVKYTIDPHYIIALEMLKKFNELGHESRIVFWFDN